MCKVPSRQNSEVSSSTQAGWRTEEDAFSGQVWLCIYIAMYKGTWSLDLNAMLYIPVYHHQSFSTVALPFPPFPSPSLLFPSFAITADDVDDYFFKL